MHFYVVTYCTDLNNIFFNISNGFLFSKLKTWLNKTINNAHEIIHIWVAQVAYKIYMFIYILWMHVHFAITSMWISVCYSVIFAKKNVMLGRRWYEVSMCWTFLFYLIFCSLVQKKKVMHFYFFPMLSTEKIFNLHYHKKNHHHNLYTRNKNKQHTLELNINKLTRRSVVYCMLGIKIVYIYMVNYLQHVIN